MIFLKSNLIKLEIDKPLDSLENKEEMKLYMSKSIEWGNTIYLIRTHYERIAAGLDLPENQNPDKDTGLF